MRKLYLVLLATLISFNAANGQLPPNMYADTAHAPFIYGVASGDPTESGIMLWTHIEDGGLTSRNVNWELASDTSFSAIIASGTISTDATTDWTVKTFVEGLAAGTTYYYRFHDGTGNYSVIGRTKTARSGASNQIRFAVMSCSSIYSGYFNAYRRIGEREHLDLVIHVGDYIYDFVDADEEVRVPIPAPVDPDTLPEWRSTHRYHLLDPDLRYARQMHPWTAIWDNHDVHNDSARFVQAAQAFYEYLPIRQPDSLDPTRIYKKISYGNLVDLFMIDILQYRDTDSIPTGGPVLLGDTQYDWFTNELLASTAKWKVVGNQNMMGGWSVIGFPAWFPLGDGQVLDNTTWDGYKEERLRVLEFIENNSIDNVIVLSGDSHVSMSIDLATDPYDAGVYDRNTGNGAVAVEFLPTSISRGNMDEMGFGGVLGTILLSASNLANPNHVYTELESHGYGLLDIKPDSAVGEYWYNEILSPTTTEAFGKALKVMDGVNHWERDEVTSPTLPLDSITSINTAGNLPEYLSEVFPNPFESTFNIKVRVSSPELIRMEVRDITSGKIVKQAIYNEVGPDQEHTLGIDASELSAGTYLLVISGGRWRTTRKLTKQ